MRASISPLFDTKSKEKRKDGSFIALTMVYLENQPFHYLEESTSGTSSRGKGGRGQSYASDSPSLEYIPELIRSPSDEDSASSDGAGRSANSCPRDAPSTAMILDYSECSSNTNMSRNAFEQTKPSEKEVTTLDSDDVFDDLEESEESEDSEESELDERIELDESFELDEEEEKSPTTVILLRHVIDRTEYLDIQEELETEEPGPEIVEELPSDTRSFSRFRRPFRKAKKNPQGKTRNSSHRIPHVACFTNPKGRGKDRSLDPYTAQDFHVPKEHTGNDYLNESESRDIEPKNRLGYAENDERISLESSESTASSETESIDMPKKSSTYHRADSQSGSLNSRNSVESNENEFYTVSTTGSKSKVERQRTRQNSADLNLVAQVSNHSQRQRSGSGTQVPSHTLATDGSVSTTSLTSFKIKRGEDEKSTKSSKSGLSLRSFRLFKRKGAKGSNRDDDTKTMKSTRSFFSFRRKKNSSKKDSKRKEPPRWRRRVSKVGSRQPHFIATLIVS